VWSNQQNFFSLSRKYLPILKNMPNRYIHEPWMAPDSVQRASKCVVGKDYPMPMINHSHAARINIERMKQVYQSLKEFRDFGKCKQEGLITSL
jgi:cryptochrome